MTLNLWLFYILTILALMSTPGPSQLLMLANSGSHGFRPALATLAGDLSANTIQMLAAALGVGVLIASWSPGLTVIKWAGVGYLAWHAIRTIKNAGAMGVDSKNGAAKTKKRTLYLQGFMTSMTNPKAVLFFAALFPHFISYGGNVAVQFVILAATYLAIDGVFLASYGLGARGIVAFLKPGSAIWVGRIGGGLMLLAAILLGFKSIDGIGGFQ